MSPLRFLTPLLVLAVLAPATADAATRSLDVRAVSAPAQVTTATTVRLKVTVRNRAARATKATKLRVLLSGDGRLDKRDFALTGKLKVPRVAAKRTKTVKGALSLPARVRPGRYRLIVCAGKRCRASKSWLRVVAAPGRPTPAPAPAPAPAPQPQPAPSATATPTATPTATATPAPTPDAPAVQPGLPTDFSRSIEFLYEGPNAVQTGVAPGTIKTQRAAVLRGTVKSRAGDGLGGVKVTVLDHPELGQTTTREDGGYDLAVNGGGALTLTFERAGYIPAQRQETVPWKDFAAIDDVVLVAFDPRVTKIDANSSTAQVATGTPVTDADGTRTASVLFPPSTKAEMVLPDGTTKPLTTLNVRATEFTAGPSGEQAMPGTLPPSSAYTYAAELSVDEAVAAGATEVRFDKPVVNYVDNFLHFPVGEPVPTGYYDRAEGRWKAAPNGRVIKLLAVVDGKARIDTDGDGAADDGLGIDDAERARLAETRHVGDELWRVPMDHFTPWDHNWPWAPAEDAESPNPPEPRPDIPTNRRQSDCNKKGSIIGCQGQTLAEELPVTGTPLKLRYDSRRSGRRTDRSLEIPLTGRTIPQSLEQVKLEVEVAGRRQTWSFAPKANLAYEFVWDRRDAYGREVQGRQPLTIRIGYVYGLVRYESAAAFNAAFGKFSTSGELIGEPRDESSKYVSWRTVRDEFGVAVGSLDARGTGLGEWELDVHHAYDARMRTLYRGDGLEVAAEPVLDTLASTVKAGDPRDADIAPDGSVWVANAATDQVLRFERNGDMSVMAGSVGGGGGCENCLKRADDPLAKGFPFSRPVAVALAPDGGFYVADFLIDYGVQYSYIYRVDPQGRIRHIAGCMCAQLGDGGPALDASMTAMDLAVGGDGTLYIADHRNARIRAVDLDGTIRTVAGGGSETDGYKDGIQGPQAHLYAPLAVETGPEGEVYFGDDGRSGRVRRLDPDGSVTTVAGGNPFDADDNGDGGPATDANLTNPQGISVGSDGALYIGDHARVRRVALDGTITTVAGGGGDSATGADRVPAGSVAFPGVAGVDVAPDGSLYVAAVSGLSRVSRPFPATADGAPAIPSKDGREVYFFDAAGRHLRTVDGLSGVVLWRFGYDADGRLSTLTDADDQVTRIERDGEGGPLAIVAPGGQRTALGSENGRLSEVKDPAGARTRLSYDAAGRLAVLIDRRGGRHEFDYDGTGRLIRDENPAGKAQTLSRKETDDGSVVTLTSPEGRKTTWATGMRPDGDAFLEVTSPSGAKTVSWMGIDGVQHQSLPNGETISRSQVPDPRWGFYVPVLERMTRRSPDGRTSVTTAERSVELADVRDPLSVVAISDRVTSNGRTAVTAYDAATRTETVTSAEGRGTSKTYDARGRVVRSVPGPGIAPITYAYDERGLLRKATQGTRSLRWEPDGRGRPAVRIDAAGRRTELTYDDADRVIAIKRPRGGTERFEYDAEGARTAVITPNGKRHTLKRDVRGAFAGYESALGALVARGHNADGQLTSEGETVFGYEAAGGRATGASWADAVVSYAYEDVLDRPASMTRTAGGVAETTAFTYDGAQTTGIASTAGAYTYGHDTNGFLTSSKLVSGAQTVTTALTRDDDGLLTGVGPFTFVREGAGGTASAITGAGLQETIDRDDAGRLTGRTLTAGGNERYKLVIEYAADGKIARRTETVEGVAHVDEYVYDDDGQLREVKRDGAVVERYAYDANGNRETRRLGEGALETSTFDAENRLLARGAVAHAYDAAGFLTTRGGDTFDYSARGELLSATVGGTTVSYRYDALNRRVARVQGADVTQYLYGDPGNPMRVTASRSAAGVLTTYSYDEDGMLFALERGGQRFFVATDQVGTPRVVTNSAGAVQTVRTYDAFGGLVSETQPAFDLPIGYAGGLEDRVTGLVRFGYRDLDTASGRWTARDPALYGGGQANLYAYVGGDPVALRDPLGLWCVGGSVYDGVGGGATICHTDEGTAVCFEVGFGFGVSAGIDNGGLPRDGESIVAEAKANVPGFGVGIGGELNDCGEVTPLGSLDLIAVNVNVMDGTLQLEPPVLQESLQIKLAAKVCRRL